MGKHGAEWMFWAVSLTVSLRMLSTPSIAQVLGNGGVNVLTWHNDTYRTGDNLNESTLTYNTIGGSTRRTRTSELTAYSPPVPLAARSTAQALPSPTRLG